MCIFKEKNKQQNKIQPKQWITLGLQISIKKKNAIFAELFKCKNSLNSIILKTILMVVKKILRL